MRTEAKKRFLRGFLLTEQELRRLVASISGQLEKAPCTSPIDVEFEIKFRNGSISSGATLDEVIELENAGTSAVERLKLSMTQRPPQVEYSVDVTFATVGPTDDEPPMRYHINGADRDWVFVTSSLIEERLARIGRFAWSRFPPWWLNIPFAFILLVASALAVRFDQTRTLGKQHRIEIDSVESGWRSGALRDPVQAIIQLERSRLKREDPPSIRGEVERAAVVGACLIGAMFLLGKIRPDYTFYWGDAIVAYDRRVRTSYFLGVVLLLGLVLSIAGSLLASRIRF